jgi:hypothetical protein
MKIKSAIDSSRRDLSGTIIGFVGTSAGTNPFQEYSNPDLRYLTFIQIRKNEDNSKYSITVCLKHLRTYVIFARNTRNQRTDEEI